MKKQQLKNEVSSELDRFEQTANAREARWPGGHSGIKGRWETKRDEIIIFIARIGWATSDLVNYYLGQKSKTWLKKNAR